MTRTLLVAVAIAAVATPAVAAPRTPPPRTVTAGYTVSGVGGVISGGASAQGSSTGAVYVPLRRHERFVKVSLADATGMAAAGEVAMDYNHDNLADQWLGTFCGATEGTLRIPNTDGTVVVYPVAGQCGNGVGTATQGTATIVLGATAHF